ncbi:CsgG/HfaB family protein [Puniceicoccaceae bacterium K14]|nr:CsgG/HfaB family protein [Puniceicoccaceae bacterium K14]
MLTYKILLTVASLAILATLTFAVKQSQAADLKSDLTNTDYTGIKHAIGVTNFETANERNYDNDLSSNLAVMLEEALFETGRFVIADREELSNIPIERNLQKSGRATQAKAFAPTGLISSTKYIVAGSITRLENKTVSNDGGSSKNIRSNGNSDRAEIEVIINVVDTTTNEVVASKHIVGVAGRSKIQTGFYKNGVPGRLDSFAKTPLGQAAQDCISATTDFIVLEMKDYDLAANVVMIKSDEMIVINRGEIYGVSAGTIFEVRKVGGPNTSEVLDLPEETAIGSIEVTRTSDKVAYCKLIEGVAPTRGDSVVFKPATSNW